MIEPLAHVVVPVWPCVMSPAQCGWGVCGSCQGDGTRLGAPIATVGGTGPGATITWQEIR